MMCAARLIAFLKSCVSCQALAEALKQNSTLTDLNLGYNKIGDQGAKAWCLVRMGSWGEKSSAEIQKGWKEGSRHGHVKVTLGKWRKAIQRSVDFQMHSSGWNLWWQVIGVFWCILHVLARSSLKRETIHNSSISKTGHPVIFKF